MTSTELAPFEAEHARLRRGLEGIRHTAAELDSLDPNRRQRRLADVLAFLDGTLARHAQAEEAELYPFVARQLRHPAAIEPMVFDHELVRELPARSPIPDGRPPRLRELLYSLYAILDSHFRKEERFYLPIVADAHLVDEIHASMLTIEQGRPVTLVRGDRRGPRGFPLDGEDDEKLAWSVPHAIRAPSSHNSQPWLFQVEHGMLELLADRTRALPVVDPHDRELTISCGAALFHLRTALRMAGEMPTVELLPEPARADLLARVSLSGESADPSPGEKRLFWSIRKRRTNRSRYTDEPVSDELLAALGRAAAEEGATLVVVRDDERHLALAKLIAEGDRLQAGDPSFRRELASWLHSRRARSQDGMPGSPHFVRTFDWGRRRAAKDEQLALGSPVLAVLTTPGDEPADWLAAGQALAHVLLRATVDDVVASFLNQPVEVGALRRRVTELAGEGVPQLVLRLGYGDAVPSTPRRPVADVLTQAARPR